MKILLPYFTRNDIKISDSVVIGGIERFAQLIYQNFDQVIPVHFTDEDRKQRRVTTKIAAAVNHHNPDVIIINYDNDPLTVRLQNTVETPILWISHTAAGGISKIGHVQSMNKFIEKCGVLAMVSDHQYQGMNKLSLRIDGIELLLNGGFINSAFSKGDEKVSEEILYDAATVGRTDKTKNPFWLHKKVENSKIHSLVLTSHVPELLYGDHREYYENNIHWKYPNETIRGLSHKETMETMSKSGCYVSTCPVETWGITALEALAHGLPTVLVTNSTNTHASECIPASSEHITKLKSNVKSDEVVEVIRKLNKINYNQRLEISEMTKEKHSLEKWKNNLINILDKTIENKKNTKRISWFD